ncbi:hypothetical protein Tco_0232149 [Tanacetum coccineum]
MALPVSSTTEIFAQLALKGYATDSDKLTFKKEELQIARDEEMLYSGDERRRKRAMDEAKTQMKIDWNDPSSQSLKRFGILIKIIEPIDARKRSKKAKSPEKERSLEKNVEEKVVTQEQKEEVLKRKKPGTKRKKFIPRTEHKENGQKMEEGFRERITQRILDIKPKENFHLLSSIQRVGMEVQEYNIFTEMLSYFDRHDGRIIQTLIKERYRASRPEVYDLMLLGEIAALC